MNEIPRYKDLPIRPELPPGSSWGVFGDDDEAGAMNLLTPERVLASSQLIRRGAVFSLNWDLDTPNPPILGRRELKHTVIDGPSGPDDRYDVFYPQASSQWDGLAHVRHPEYGYYNGFTSEQVIAGTDSRLGISAWGSRGLVGRFVLADMAGFYKRRGTPLDAAVSTAVPIADVELALVEQGVELTPGTFLLLNFGWMDWYLASDAATKRRLAQFRDFDRVEDDLENFFPAPGLQRGEDVAEWLWDAGVVAIIGDCPGVEVAPMHREGPDGFLHYRVTALLGIAYGEMWDLRALTDDCRADGVYEGLLVSAPFNKRGGTGSTANAVAIK